MKPYPENAHTTDAEKNFNYRQSRARMVVENALSRLKGRWRCLLKRMDFKLKNVTNIVAACVVLHNMCEQFGDQFLEEWATHEENTPPIPSHGSSSHGSADASNIRNAIMKYLSK